MEQKVHRDAGTGEFVTEDAAKADPDGTVAETVEIARPKGYVKLKAPGDLYIGTKQLLAAPMTRGEYNEYRGWTPPEGEDQDVAGWLVEYLDGGEPNDARHFGYISWSPAPVFAQAYGYVGGGNELNFGQALELLKAGHAVARDGWNGKGMFVYLVGPGRYAPSTPTGVQIAKGQDDGLVPYKPYLAMKCVDGEVVPWLISQTDALAEDWGLALWWAPSTDE